MVIAAPSASACLNDAESAGAEGEFRARYTDPPSTPPRRVPVSPTLLIVGTATVAVLTGVWWVRRARRA